MTVKFTNNASTTVATGINSSATSLTVTSASAFPSLSGADDYCYLTIQQATGTGLEVAKATALSTNTFTIIRAQDNTTAQAFSAGDRVELRMTAALLTDVIDASTVEGVKTNFQYTPTAGQTVFSGADNSSNTLIINQSGLVNVYMNGVRLVQGTDYTVSAANNTITLTAGATTADIIDIEVYGSATSATWASAVAITGGAISGTSIAATTLSASGTATLNTFVSNNSTISGGTINNVAVGGTTQAAGSFSDLNATTSLEVPAGTTGQRPGSPSAGSFRYNTTSGSFEGYSNAWGAIGVPVDNTITTAKLVDDAVTAAKIADNSVDISRLNVSDGTAGQSLTTNGSGTLAFATIGGAFNDFAIKTGNYTAVSKDQLIVNSSSAVTITLPASPSAGNVVFIKNAGTGTVTVARNGSNINSTADDGELAADAGASLVYVDSTIGWKEL